MEPSRRPTACPRSRVRGATLAEVCVSLACLGVLLGVGVPEVGSWIHHTQLASHGTSFVFDLYRARSEAIKRNSPVALCKSAGGETCDLTGGWEQGSILFQDRNNNTVRDPGEPLLHRSPPLPAGWRLTGNQPVRHYVSYASNGMTRMESGAFQAGTVTLCRQSATSTEARQVVINAGGRPRTQKAVVEACP